MQLAGAQAWSRSALGLTYDAALLLLGYVAQVHPTLDGLAITCPMEHCPPNCSANKRSLHTLDLVTVWLGFEDWGRRAVPQSLLLLLPFYQQVASTLGLVVGLRSVRDQPAGAVHDEQGVCFRMRQTGWLALVVQVLQRLFSVLGVPR